MGIVDLQRPDLLPKELILLLSSIVSQCLDEKFSEELVQHPEVNKIAIELDHYCMQRQVWGIHYTNAIRSDIEKNGLLIRTGAEIRADFLQRFGHMFEEDEINWLQSLWSSHQARQSDTRDSMLWFNFTLDAYGSRGSEYLLGMYGGEQVHMGVELDTPIGKKLASIGEPLIVKCALNPQEVKCSIDYPWGKILVSSFHLSISPEACRIDLDGRIREPVTPENLFIESAYYQR